jgi:competence protein ComFC
VYPVPGSSGERIIGTVSLLFGRPPVVSKPYLPQTRDLPSSCVQKILDGLLNLIYPEICFLCAVPVSRQQACGICSSCWNKAIALRIAPPRCSSCGLPFQNFEENSEHLCGNCIQKMPPYAGARSFGYYTAELSGIIQGLKFKGRRNFAGLLAPLLSETFFGSWRREDFDLIVPIPLHWKRKRERGYNQSELLARLLASQIAIPHIHALVRGRPTLPQVGLTDSQRFENLRKAFRCAKTNQISGRRVLLIDDVMTTGATVASAAQTLLEGGALRVSVLTVARVGKWD